MSIFYVHVPVGETVNVRDEARKEGKLLYTLPRGYMVDMTNAYNTGWCKVFVSAKNPQVGYIDGYYLRDYPPDGNTGGSSDWSARYGTTVWKKSLHSSTYYAAVENIQKDLRKVGYTSITNADGLYGSITETAVKNFQKNWGLTQDGICGDQTKQTLWNHPDR